MSEEAVTPLSGWKNKTAAKKHDYPRKGERAAKLPSSAVNVERSTKRKRSPYRRKSPDVNGTRPNL